MSYEMVPSGMYAPGSHLSTQLLGSILPRYCKGLSVTLGKAVPFVCDFLGRSDSVGPAGALMLPHGTLAVDGRLDDDDD